MKHFQVMVIFDGGAVMLFGVVSADGETGALLVAADRLAGFTRKADRVQVMELPGRSGI